MNDLISRQAAIEAMHQYSHYDDFDTLVLDEDIAVIALKDLPSAEPEIIRCKDCKHCEYPAPNITKYGCRLFNRCVIANWFCASAERKDNGNA